MRARVFLWVPALWCLASPSLAAGPQVAGSEVTLGLGLALAGGVAGFPRWAVDPARYHGVPVASRLAVSLGGGFWPAPESAGQGTAAPVHIELGPGFAPAWLTYFFPTAGAGLAAAGRYY